MSWHLGLDIGATKTLAAAVTDDARLLDSVRIATPRDADPADVLGAATDAVRQLTTRHGPMTTVGAGFAGLVDTHHGRVLGSIMLPGWDEFPLAERLAAAFGAPAVAENDAAAAGYGEWVALGEPATLNMVVITVGTGIGGAIIIGGRLYRGALGTAAEFGNMTIDRHGAVCWCGNRGCLNMSGSGTAIAAHAASAAANEAASLLHGRGDRISLEDVGAAADRGDRIALIAIDEGARALGTGLANVINILNPDRIALCGGVTGLGSRWLASVRGEAQTRAFGAPASHVRIELSVVGAAVGAFGAACLARDRARGRVC